MTQTTRILIFSVLFQLGLIATAFSQQVEASLSEGFARVGQAVQLTISVTGGRGADVPSKVNVDGLEVRFIQRSSRFEMMNGRTTSSMSYTYLVIPLQEGNFTIPPIEVMIGGKSFTTNPLKLQVGGGGGSMPVMPAIPVPQTQRRSAPPTQYMPPTRPSQQPPAEEGKIAFADLLVPKKTAYVGEVVPVEIRFFFDSRYSVQLNEKPTFVGDGFTVLRYSKPIERQQEINGRIYNVASFQTALVPAKTGTLEIPGAKVEAQIQVPGSMPPGFENFFGGILGNMAGMENQALTLESPAMTLEVKPLPKDGRPENFSGAIGKFGLTSTVTPKKAASGDPISMQVTISGQGNFEAMGAPTLTDTEGWRTYPPSDNFEPSAGDAIGLNGEKKFEYMIVAREDRTMSPGVGFSYFDPAVAKYVSLSSKPVPVEAKGSSTSSPAAQQTTVAPATPQASPTAATPTPTPESGRESLLEDTFIPAQFEPLVRNKTFLVTNGVLALAWLGLLLFGVIRALSGSEMAKQSAARREARKTLKDLEDPKHDATEFFQRAAQFVRTRLASEQAFTPAQELVEASHLPAETKAVLREVLERDEELKYSTSATRETVDADDRRRIVENLKIFNDALPH